MKTIHIGLLVPVFLLLTGIASGAPARLYQPKLEMTAPALRIPKPPETNSLGMDKPGPVVSPDPYFTIKIGDADIYRDALDHTLAYYKPHLTIGTRKGTSLASSTPSGLVDQLDGFLFSYYGFENNEILKWANMVIVVRSDRPEDATLEAVQAQWKDLTTLVPMKLDSLKIKMILPYPPGEVVFSELVGEGGTGDNKWYEYSTTSIANLAPVDLQYDPNNDTLDETEAREFATALKSDLSEYDSFSPKVNINATYKGWSGYSPIVRLFAPLAVKMLASEVYVQPGTLIVKPISHSPGIFIDPVYAAAGVGTVFEKRVTEKTLFTGMALKSFDFPLIIGTLKPREDIDYTYYEEANISKAIPIGFPRAKTQNYDYYFLSHDTNRIGGPWFEESDSPERPMPGIAPGNLTGWFWYESHFLGRKMIWTVPREMKLKWEVDSGMRPSCRYSLSSSGDGELTAHITYNLFPEFDNKELAAAITEIIDETGEEIELLPFTDLLDANEINLYTGDSELQDMLDDGRMSISIPPAVSENSPWFKVNVEIPVSEDWVAFTQFMKLGNLGGWDVGIRGMSETASFNFNSDLLTAMGGPAVASKESYDDTTGGFQVGLDNYGIVPLDIKGLRFKLHSTEPVNVDTWFDDVLKLPALSQASSFEQAEGSGDGIGTIIERDSLEGLKTAWDSGEYDFMEVGLTPDMVERTIGPETSDPAYEDILFSYLRSLCYQYVGESQMIQVPIDPVEDSQWIGYKSGTVIVKYQGFVYSTELDLAGENVVHMRRLPAEGAFGLAGESNNELEYRGWFVRGDDEIIYVPPESGEGSSWLPGDTSWIQIDMGATPSGETESPVTETDDIDEDNLAINALLLGLDEIVEGSVGPGDPIDYYVFDVGEGQDPAGMIRFNAPIEGTTFRISGEGGTLFEGATVDLGGILVFAVSPGNLPPGSYYIRVSYWSDYNYDHDYTIEMYLE